MAKISKKNEEPKEIPVEKKPGLLPPETLEKKEIPLEKKPTVPTQEAAPVLEKTIEEQLRREIAMMELSPELQKEAIKKAKIIEFLGEKEKLERLVALARERGPVFATRVAREINDPHILDNFHDVLIILIKEGSVKISLPS